LQVLSIHRIVQHGVRAIVALLALSVAAVVLAACGGGEDGGSGGDSSDAQTLLTQTFTGRHEIRSGRTDIQLRVLVEGVPALRGPIDLSISGPFQSAGEDKLPSFDLAIDADSQGQGLEAGLTSTSDRLFVKFGGTAYVAPPELMRQLRASYERAQDEGSAQQQMGLASLGLDPMSWLENPTVEGTESIGGTETEHVSAQLDVSALLDDVDVLLGKARDQNLGGAAGRQVPERLPADTRAQIEDAVERGTVDVWTGSDDHTLRQLAVDLHIVLPESSNGPRSIDVSLRVTLTELNEPQTITAPATSRPLDELLDQVRGLLGGALGGFDAGGSGGSDGASQEQLDAYTQCIQDAGADVARAQECASLLTE
jgi:hypothetical protein